MDRKKRNDDVDDHDHNDDGVTARSRGNIGEEEEEEEEVGGYERKGKRETFHESSVTGVQVLVRG